MSNVKRVGILDEYLTTEEMSVELEVAKRTLDRWAAARIGPPRIKIGGEWRYPVHGAKTWLTGLEKKAEETAVGQVRRGPRRTTDRTGRGSRLASRLTVE
jgi:hypothetical protein